ncbi:MAG: phosphatase PAP2 family protein [Alphaproteobacteria bacterium]
MTIVPLEPQEPLILRSTAKSLVCIAASIGLAAALIFAAFPGIDIAVSKFFYFDGHTFLFARGTTGDVIRNLLRLVFVLACVGALAGFVMIAFFSRRLLGFGFAAWTYLLLCIITGPGLVANVVFKDHWGRARPMQVEEFGGHKKFTPALTRSDQCAKNCSFVSGEASNIFIIGFALALLAEASRRRRMYQYAIGAGAFAGLIRIGAGAHFLSDVVFAGVFMAFVARWLAWLLFERFEAQTADDGPVHRRLHWMGHRMATWSLNAWRIAKERVQKWRGK